MTQSQVDNFLRLAVKPWKQYVPWGPDDMPPRGGCKRALERVLRDSEITKEEVESE